MEWLGEVEANAAMGWSIRLILHQPQCDCVQHFARTQNKYVFFASQFHIITMHHLDINLIRWYLTSNGGSEDSIYW